MSKSRDIADSAATINFIDNLTSDAQTQLNTLDTEIDNISVTSGSLTKTFVADEVATITLSGNVLSPVVGVTKEVAQTGTTNNSWDVNSTTENYTRLNSAPATTLDFVFGDLAASSFVDAFSVSTEDTAPSDIAFNNDGTKVFVMGNTSNNVYEYDLTTAYDISTASYSGNSLSVGSQSGGGSGIAFNADGTKLFMCEYLNDTVYQYNLTTGFDLSTGSYASVSFSVASQATAPHAIRFKPDGTKMYIIGNNTDKVYEYTLTTGFDLTTASYSGNFIDISSEEPIGVGLDINSDGTKVYVVGTTNDTVYEYTLSTAYDLSTASYSGNSFSVATQELTPNGIAFNPSSSKFFIVGTTGDDINEYNTGVSAVSLGTGSFASADVGKTIEANNGVFILTSTAGAFTETTAPTSYAQVASGSWEMYAVVYNTTDGDLELSKTSPQNPYNVSGATFASSQNILTYESSISGIQFNNDGTKMFIIGYGGVEINEFSLSVPYDPTTLSLNSTLSVSSQDSVPTDLYFKSDGLTLFVLGYTSQTVYEYTLTTAFDISTASYSSNSFSVSAQASSPSGLYFKDDGTTLYIADLSGYFQQYTLSTAWDITTASYASKNLNVNSQDTAPTGLVFNSDGTKLYLVGYGSYSLHSYSVSTAWDISTASYDSISLYLASYTTLPRGLTFEQDGATLFIAGQSTNVVIKFNSATTYIPSGYHAVHTTNSTDSTYWTDINSMTADEAAGDGSIYYAVSTDDRATWKIAHNTDGIRSIVRNNSGTWQYNSNGTYASTTWTNATTNTELNALQEAMTGATTFDAYDLTNASYDSVTFSTGGQDNSGQGFVFADSGTKAYIAGNTNRRIYQYTLSTAYDISTASYSSNSFYINEDSFVNGVAISSDGTKMYVGGLATSSVYEYDLSTAYDVSTASYNSVSFNVSSQTGSANGPIDISFKPDGTKMYVSGQSPKYVWQYALSTAWDLSTASYDNKVSSEGVLTHFTISSDGTVLIKTAGTTVSKFNMSTAWDISTASSTADQTLDTTGTEAYNSGIGFNADGSKLILLGRTTNDALYQWSSTGTVSYPNQMNKTQLDAVSDANHFTLANDLDLGIIFNLSSGTTVPSSDGVSINYDANVLNKGAILGTDYDYDAPAQNKVRITALTGNNLKVRVV